MSGIGNYIVEATILAIAVFWVGANADKFDKVITASTGALVGSARSIWGY
jgi:hypothetical protein